jgi:hypothetical protein
MYSTVLYCTQQPSTSKLPRNDGRASSDDANVRLGSVSIRRPVCR